ncbi:MAG: N-acetyltransferase [Sphingobium sp.]|nr:N-acetyltransferase [Sphingobium sp.]
MGIHATAIVDPSARIGDDVEIGPFTIVHGNVEIGDRTVIENHCEIGRPTPLADGSPLHIGPRSLIRSHSVFYEGSSFGERLETGHNVCVRETTRAGVNLRIGTGSDIQGSCVIGNYVRLHSQVHIGSQSIVGSFVWIFPNVVLTNDPTPPSYIVLGVTVEDYAIVATGSVVLPGKTIGRGALIGASTLVHRDVPPEVVACGNPMEVRGPTSGVKLRDGSGPAYPWTRHFHRGYPPEIIENWAATRSS